MDVLLFMSQQPQHTELREDVGAVVGDNGRKALQALLAARGST